MDQAVEAVGAGGVGDVVSHGSASHGRAGIEAGCWYLILPDGYALVRFGINDVASAPTI